MSRAGTLLNGVDDVARIGNSTTQNIIKGESYAEISAAKGAEAFNSDLGAIHDNRFPGNNGLNPLERGPTGRTVPANLNEQIAMEQAMSNPYKGEELPLQLGDTRWPASEGWVKMRQRINNIEVHYVRNKITGAEDEYKFK